MFQMWSKICLQQCASFEPFQTRIKAHGSLFCVSLNKSLPNVAVAHEHKTVACRRVCGCNPLAKRNSSARCVFVTCSEYFEVKLNIKAVRFLCCFMCVVLDQK